MTHRLTAQRGYWCECHTRTLNEQAEGPTAVASFTALNAPQAVRWIRIALRTITPALDEGPFTQAWQWVTYDHAYALQALRRGHPCGVTIQHRDTRITWTARPVHFLPLAHRQPGTLPPCAERFSTAQLPHGR